MFNEWNIQFDVPLDKAMQAGYYEDMVDLIRNLFGQALKTNDSLQFAVLTGCLRVSKESGPGSEGTSGVLRVV